MEPRPRDYRDLEAWRHAIRLAVECHGLTKRVRRRDCGVLVRQLRRASTSVGANIAEGNGRSSRAEYLHFLSIANGSLREVESHLLLLRALGAVPEREAAAALVLVTRTAQLLSGLVRALRKTQ